VELPEERPRGCEGRCLTPLIWPLWSLVSDFYESKLI
jgi:hypothetical protein